MINDESFATNIPEWFLGFMNSFETGGLKHFLNEFSSFEVPSSALAKLTIDRHRKEVVAGWKRDKRFGSSYENTDSDSVKDESQSAWSTPSRRQQIDKV